MNRDVRLSPGTKVLRIVALVSVLFVTSSTGLSAQADKKAPEDAKIEIGDGMVVVPIPKLLEIQAGVATLLNQKELLEKQLEEAQSTIRYGMGCT